MPKLPILLALKDRSIEVSSLVIDSRIRCLNQSIKNGSFQGQIFPNQLAFVLKDGGAR